MTGGNPLVVIGDALLDADLIGRPGRLMPDAPAPVLDELHERIRPGGAALAACLAAADGEEVVLVTGLVQDESGARLQAECEEAGVRVVAVPHDGSTPTKRRVLASGRPLARLDEGACGRIGPVPGDALEVLDSASAVLVSDYGHGLTAHPEVRTALAGLSRSTPVVWDPHPRGSAPVPGVTLATPNRDEAARLAAMQQNPDEGELARVSRHAAALMDQWQAHAVSVTLGASGALLSRGEPMPAVISAPTVAATDTCGAGDRFAVVAAASLAHGALVPEAVQAAVTAASAFVAAGGASAYRLVGPVPGDQGHAGPDRIAAVRAAGGTVVATGGCFDLLHPGHIATLEAARALGDCLVVCLNSDASVARLKGPDRPLISATDRARILAALACVDEVVIFEDDTPKTVISALRPDVWVKGGDYAGADLPEADLLASWGGQAVVVPYLAGHSTTALVASARGW